MRRPGAAQTGVSGVCLGVARSEGAVCATGVKRAPPRLPASSTASSGSHESPLSLMSSSSSSSSSDSALRSISVDVVPVWPEGW